MGALCTTMPADQREPDADSWYAVGQDHNRSGRYAEAVAAYSAALEIDPRHATARLGRGMALQRLGEHETAIHDFTEVIQSFPRWAGLCYAYYGRASSHHALGRLPAVVDDCNEALRSNPENLDALYLRGIALKHLDELERATEDMSGVIEADPTYREAYYTRGTLLMLEGRYEEALADLSTYLNLSSPTDEFAVGCHHLRGVAAFELGQHQAALEYFTLAIEAEPANASSYMRRSQVYRAMGDSERAEADFDKGRSLLRSS